jgi:hypothetical protein
MCKLFAAFFAVNKVGIHRIPAGCCLGAEALRLSITLFHEVMHRPPSEVQDAESNVRTAAQIGHPDSVLAWTGRASAVGHIALTLLTAIRERPREPVSSSRLLARRTGRETGRNAEPHSL